MGQTITRSQATDLLKNRESYKTLLTLRESNQLLCDKHNILVMYLTDNNILTNESKYLWLKFQTSPKQ